MNESCRPEPPPSTDDRWARVWPVALTAVFCTGVFLRFFFLVGPVGSDDTNYLVFAHKFLSLQRFEVVYHGAGRLLFLLLIGWPVELFGHAIYGAAANVLYSALADLVVITFCLRRFGPRPALAAAALLAFDPIPIQFSGMLLPDPTLGLFLVLAAVTLERARESLPARRRLGLAFLAGVLSGLAYLCKDPGALFVPVACAVLFFFPRERSLRERLLPAGLVVSGFALVFVLDGLVYLGFTGDFLYRAHAIAAVHNRSIPALPPGEFVRHAWSQLVRVAQGREYFGAFRLGVPLLVAALLVTRRYLLFSALGLFLAFYLLFGTSSFPALIPLPVQPRYFHPILLLSALAAGILFDRLSPLRRPWIFVAAILALGVTQIQNGYPVLRVRPGMRYSTAFYRTLRLAAEILEPEGKPLLVEAHARAHLAHFVSPALHGKLLVIPEQAPLGCGYYLLAADSTGLPPGRLAELRALGQKLRFTMDNRSANQFRQQPDYLRPPPEVVVFEKPCAVPDPGPKRNGDSPGAR